MEERIFKNIFNTVSQKIIKLLKKLSFRGFLIKSRSNHVTIVFRELKNLVIFKRIKSHNS